jgi:hypothetical protein
MRRLLMLGAVLVGFTVLGAGHATATNNCDFTTVRTTMRLKADCTTNAPIFIPNGVTFDGQGHTITAVDPSDLPPNNHFRGAVLTTTGAVAHVKRVTITAAGLADVCDTGDDRLRGIFFNGASGSIRDVTIVGIHQTLPTVCPEGSGIVVNKAPFDDTHPAIAFVEIDHVKVINMSRVGIQGLGDVSLKIRDSEIRGVPMSQIVPDQYGVFIAGGALGSIKGTTIRQKWDRNVSPFAFGVYIEDASGVYVEENSIIGSTEGVYVVADCILTTGVANGNRIAQNQIRAAREGVVLIALAGLCGTTQVNNNKVIENNIGSASGFTALKGIFVGVRPVGTTTVQADSNVIKENRIRNTVDDIIQDGDTNTVLRHNVFIP